MRIRYLNLAALVGWTLLFATPDLPILAQNAAPPSRVPFCELAMNVPKYDGKIVLTEGVVRESIHTNIFFDPLCSDRSTKSGQSLSAVPAFAEIEYLKSRLGLQYLEALKQDGCVRVLLIGRVDSLQGPYGAGGLLFKITIESLISVYEIPKTERDTFELRKMDPPPIHK
jgi:hypothetical protein